MPLRFNGDHWFYHVPRCGGNYVRRVISRLAIKGHRVLAENRGHGHGTPLQTVAPVGRSFCVVRQDVLGWYRSFYRYRVYKHKTLQGMDAAHPLDFGMWDRADEPEFSFDHFLNYALRRFPHGWLTALYCQYVPFVDVVLFTDSLTAELPKLFEQWGYDVPVKLPPWATNSSPKGIQADAARATEQQLLRAEAGALNLIRTIRKGNNGRKWTTAAVAAQHAVRAADSSA
jgi:hypothetical protein